MAKVHINKALQLNLKKAMALKQFLDQVSKKKAVVICLAACLAGRKNKWSINRPVGRGICALDVVQTVGSKTGCSRCFTGGVITGLSLQLWSG